MEKENKSGAKRYAFLSLAALFAVVLGGVGGYFLYEGLHGLSDDEKKLVEEYRVLKDEWLFGNEEQYLSDYALSGLALGIASSGDDSYTFYTPTVEDQNLSVSHVGFGIETRPYDGGLYIVDVHNGPAKDKLHPGDVLYGATRSGEDYYDFTTHSPDEVTAYLGDEGSILKTYTFRVLCGEEMTEVSLSKNNYIENMVEVLKTPSAENGYSLVLRLPTFLGSPSEALKNLLSDYQTKYSIKRLVLDMRGNGGGYVSECEQMAKLFVRKGTLIEEMHDKDGNVLSATYQDGEPLFHFDSYAILLDHGSASATETFALAMRAGADATIYGLTSYGKGIAQKFKTFSDGSTMRYTYAYVYGPEKANEWMYGEGEDDDDILCIHKKGILPDQPFSYDYQWLNTLPTITESIAVAEQSQNFVLRLLDMVDEEDSIPSSYEEDYHFDDAIDDFVSWYGRTYPDEEKLTAFDKNGVVTRAVFNKLTKVSYDLYLQYKDNALEEVL